MLANAPIRNRRLSHGLDRKQGAGHSQISCRFHKSLGTIRFDNTKTVKNCFDKMVDNRPQDSLLAGPKIRLCGAARANTLHHSTLRFRREPKPLIVQDREHR
jgi:hypothetical protein